MTIKPAQSKTLIPAIAAIGSGLVTLPASAIELGEMEVHSRLGQPLRASIAYALGPDESLFDYCVSLSQSKAAGGMPAIRRASVSLANGVISLTGETPVREPLVTARVIVDCPYTAHLSREYMMFIDPPTATVQAAAPAKVTVPVAAARPQPAPAIRPRPVPQLQPAPIENATTYLVQRGDTLSGIAQRIENRPVGLWVAVNQIYAANPEAFIDSDMNKLKAGSMLQIPAFGASTPLTVNSAAPAPGAVAESSAEMRPAEARPAEARPAEVRPAASEAPGKAPAQAEIAETAPAETVVIPDTALEAPTVTAQSPNVPSASISRPAAPLPAPEQSGRSYAWLLWLGGAGIALIVGLLMFGRRSRDIVDAPPLELATSHPMRRRSDLDPTDTESLPVISEDEYDIDDDSPTAENLALDADLVIGTGLDKGVDVDVAEDFSFAPSGSLDLELPEEMSSVTGTHNTDKMPAVSLDDSAILVNELLPAEEDADDYDMSVIVDATKVPDPEDTTERDLKAVVLNDSLDETLIDDSYTLSQEVDFKILQQDYEDEMTATQKLNAEIAKAATELTESMQRMEQETDLSQTMATVTELDVTAQLPARNDDVSDPDDTGEITLNIDNDKTLKLSTGDNDKTAEMDIESGKVDTKAG